MRLRSWAPSILRPKHCWSVIIANEISHTTPPTPKTSNRFMRRFWGAIHHALRKISPIYCSWFGQSTGPHIWDLPFGLVLKWTDRVSIEEAAAMQMTRAAGMPVPKFLCLGEHPGIKTGLFSILMTRLPGFEIPPTRDTEVFEEWEAGTWVEDLQRCLDAMRAWKSPYGEKRICSVLDTRIKSTRVPDHAMGPFEDEAQMHHYLLAPASTYGFKSEEEFSETLASARQIREMPHRVVFTHGDFKDHNILVDEHDNLTGFLDWECTGWLPEYWDYCTAMRFGQGSFWHYKVAKMGGKDYAAELKSDKDLNRLTVSSYVGF